MVLSALADASDPSSKLIINRTACVWPINFLVSIVVVGFQMLIDPFRDPDAI